MVVIRALAVYFCIDAGILSVRTTKTMTLSSWISGAKRCWMNKWRLGANRRRYLPDDLKRLPDAPRRDVTDIRPEGIDVPEVGERTTALTIVAGVILTAAVISYVRYCFYITAEKIKKIPDGSGVNPQ
jgi:hypothetical protein